MHYSPVPTVAEFWTPERLTKARAMRRYRRLWSACSEAEQWAHEVAVYRWRALGLPESEVGRLVEAVLDLSRPWRLSDRELCKRLRARQRKPKRWGR